MRSSWPAWACTGGRWLLAGGYRWHACGCGWGSGAKAGGSALQTSYGVPSNRLHRVRMRLHVQGTQAPEQVARKQEAPDTSVASTEDALQSRTFVCIALQSTLLQKMKRFHRNCGRSRRLERARELKRERESSRERESESCHIHSSHPEHHSTPNQARLRLCSDTQQFGHRDSIVRPQRGCFTAWHSLANSWPDARTQWHGSQTVNKTKNQALSQSR